MKQQWEWKTDLEEVAYWAKKVTKAQVSTLVHTAGGRPVTMFSYGEQELQKPMANYSSACGSMDVTAYLDRKQKKPVVLLVGAIHGQETEGTQALLQLLSLLETGKDLRGKTYEGLCELAKKVRLLIIPVMNADGRARVKVQTEVGLTLAQHQYWGQGVALDGTLYSWPGCKKVHPILEHSKVLGGYYNDDGINMMHDCFFSKMAEETKALLTLLEEEQVDYTLQLHGGGNSVNCLLKAAYVPVEVNETIRELAGRCNAKGEPYGLPFPVFDMPPREQGDTPPSFNLVSAMHHINGSMAMVFESNEGIVDLSGRKMTADEIMDSHMILFEELLQMSLERQNG